MNEKLMKTRTDIAEEKMLAGYNCAQSVLYAFCDDLGFDKNTALKLACGFGAGLARKQEVCGALSGGILVLGFKYGRGEDQAKSVTEGTYQKVRELMARFEAKHGSCICRELLEGRVLNTAEGQRSFKENDCLHKTCIGCVRMVVDTVEKLLV
jgi:C_GCAxxG_C_C family probable redox protein